MKYIFIHIIYIFIVPLCLVVLFCTATAGVDKRLLLKRKRKLVRVCAFRNVIGPGKKEHKGWCVRVVALHVHNVFSTRGKRPLSITELARNNILRGCFKDRYYYWAFDVMLCQVTLMLRVRR